MNKVQVGIDLGTTNTLACCRVKGKLKLVKFKSSTMLPSVLYVEEMPDGSVKEIVGKAAKIKGGEDPDNCIRSSKTYIGLTGSNKKTWECHGKKYTPTYVAEKILREVHDKVRSMYDLEDEDVVQAVITIPAYFTSTQSDETKRAGERAGMEVVRIITEPVAAAVSLAEDVEGKIFVVDLGGGTFDVSVLDIGEKYQTLEINGERQLGGDDFDDRLVEFFLRFIEDDLGIDFSSLETSGLDYNTYNVAMSKIRQGAIEMKENLSEDDEYELTIPELFEYGADKKKYNFSFEMTRDEFDELCDDLYKRIIKVIDETVTKSKKFKKEELKKVFLVGGSCYIPKIQEEVEKYFGFESDSQNDRAIQVAMGAGKIADAWNGFVSDKNHVDPFDVKLEDIISHSMGVKIVGKNGEDEYSEILAEGTAYPCVRKNDYKTASDNQESVIIEVYEKTDSEASDFIARNEDAYDFYGSFVLSGIKPAPAGTTPIEVTFDYDQSRTLHVTAEDKKNNIVQTVELHKGESVQESSSTVKPTDFFILLDVSGSMSGSRINEAKKACIKLVQEVLDLNVHKLGIITFGTKVNMLCGLTGEKDELMLSIDRVSIDGSTNMAGALQSASKEFEHSTNNKAVILITDGMPDSAAATDKAAAKLRGENISIATIGVQNAKQSYLRNLSKDDTLCFMVDNLDKLSDTFGQAVKNLLSK